MQKPETRRLASKTKDQQMLRLLQEAFNQPPRVAQAMLEEMQACFAGSAEQILPGQMRVMLVARSARHGTSMADTDLTEVCWTIDAGQDDCAVQEAHGMSTLRQVRIQRLLSEAVEQGALASQEDLARALQVSVRTIKRDCAKLTQQGIYLPTRGNIKGIGRGQTHKAQIVGQWLQGKTYDQIARATHHALASVRRYVQSFIRVMQLHQRGIACAEISLLLQIGLPLVQDYLAIFQQHDSPFVRSRLDQQLERLQKRTQGQKKRMR